MRLLTGLVAVAIAAVAVFLLVSPPQAGEPADPEVTVPSAIPPLNAYVRGITGALDFRHEGLATAVDPAVDDLASAIHRYFSTRADGAHESWLVAHTAGGDDDLLRWDAGRHIAFGAAGPWPVPDDPTWAEDPFQDPRWQSWYQSLVWLDALRLGHETTGDEGYLADATHLVNDWIAANPRSGPAVQGPWDYASVTARTDMLVSLYPVLRPRLAAAELERYLVALHEHGRTLATGLSRVSGANVDRTVELVGSLYNLAAAFPELKGAVGWRTGARERLSTVIPEVADSDGAMLTQSTKEFFTALDRIADVDRFLDQFDDGLLAAEREHLVKMIDFGARLTLPDGSVPAIGDTSYPTTRNLDKFADQALLSDQAEYVRSHGVDGVAPPQAAFYPEAGYAVVRPTYSGTGSWQDDLHVVMDATAGRAGHPGGHDDAMNLLVYAYGTPMLIDSGGPYGDGPEADAFVSAQAHNTVVVDEGTYGPGDAGIERTVDAGAFSLIQASHDLWPTAHHRRTTVLIEPWTIVVVDQLTATDGKEHQFDLLYHLPPGAAPSHSGLAVDARVGGQATLGLVVEASHPTALRVIEGQEQPSLQGWITSGVDSRTPAPVVSYRQNAESAWFVTMLTPSALAKSAPMQLSVDAADGRFVIDVANEYGAWVLEIDANAGARLTAR